MRFGLIGAGNGGHAFAAYLGKKGYEVYWYDIDPEVVGTLNEQGGVYVDGELEGFAPIKKATNDMEELLSNTDIIFVITPSNAHKIIAKNCAPYVKDDQIIILSPGSTGGSLEFYKELKDNNCTADVILAETQSLLFACRLQKTGHITIHGIKKKLSIAALPAKNTESVHSKISSAFPEFKPGTNVLEVGLENINAMLHPAPSLFNFNSIENHRFFLHYMDGITDHVSHFIEKLDQERINIGKAYGLELSSTKQLLQDFYGVEGSSIKEAVNQNKAYQSIGGAQSVDNRYLTEDIPMGLIPMRELARVAKVETPNIDSLIVMVSSVLNEDFRKSARTLERLGLSEKSLEEICNMVEQGELGETLI